MLQGVTIVACLWLFVESVRCIVFVARYEAQHEYNRRGRR